MAGRTLGTDPRADPRMIAAFVPYGLDGPMPDLPVTPDSPLRQRLEWCAQSEQELAGLFADMMRAAPRASGVRTETATVPGDDGNAVSLYISRPAISGPRLPCLVHLHGGAMAFNSAADPAYTVWREHLAATGLVVVGVEFRNSAGKLGVHPYPAGLNDCAAAVRWAAAHLDDLGASHLVVSGESGGGNLTLTVTHKAKREGWLHEIAGAYAQCPYISNRWLDGSDEFPSLKENDGYFISCMQAALFGSVYDPDGTNSRDVTCWAGMATEADLTGMPPHVISVNELDPLRDEGLHYYRRLLRAGVPTVGRSVAGTCHAGDILCAAYIPDVFAASLRDLSGFAQSLG